MHASSACLAFIIHKLYKCSNICIVPVDSPALWHQYMIMLMACFTVMDESASMQNIHEPAIVMAFYYVYSSYKNNNTGPRMCNVASDSEPIATYLCKWHKCLYIYIYVCIHVSGHFRLCGLYFSYSNGPDVFELHVKMAAAFLLVLLL